ATSPTAATRAARRQAPTPRATRRATRRKRRRIRAAPAPPSRELTPVARLRRYVVAGLLVWAPVGATIFVFRLLLGLMERLLFWLPANYRPEALFPALFEFNVPALNAIVSGVLAFVVLVATGMLAANLIG